MNDNPDNSESRPEIDPALEARIVALVHGELSEEEALELENVISENPKLLVFKKQIEAVDELAKSAHSHAQPQLRMAEERRQKLLEAIRGKAADAAKNVLVGETPHRSAKVSQILIRVAASIVMAALVGAFVYFLSDFQRSPHPIATSPEESPVVLTPKALITTGIATGYLYDRDASKDAGAQLENITGDSLKTAEVKETQGSGTWAISANSVSATADAPVPMAPMSATTANAANQPVLAAQNGTPKFDGFINYGSPIFADSESSEKVKQLLIAADEFKTQGNNELVERRFRQALPVDKSEIVARQELEAAESLQNVASPTPATESHSGVKSFTNAWGLPVRRFNVGAATIVEQTDPNKSQSDDIDRKLDEKSKRRDKPTPAPTPARRQEIETSKQPSSTFSLHTGDVSFQLARNTLAANQVPDPQSIRPEEFYNAFEYGDPTPTSVEKIACRIEQSAHPFRQQRNLVRIGVKVAAAGRAANQPLRLTVLLDTSGSMEREDRVASVRRALEALTGLLGPQDRVTLIGFARSPRLLAEEVLGDQASELVNLVARTPSEGGTNLEQALTLASEMALKQRLPEAQNRIVLLTDGAANLGNDEPARLAQQIEATRQKGISFDACGVGANGLNDKILEALTRKGDGRYYFLNTPEDADAGFARKLAGTLRPAAEDVKVQVVFNPARVRHHRLIGFEEHMLKEEDFRDDAVQAAELAAEEEGIALYQVEPMPEGEGDIGQVFVRFRDPANQMTVERSWTIPYEERTPPFDRAAPSLQLAATAALLAEKLQGDNEVDVEALIPVLTALRQHFPHQAAVADLLQMCRQMKP